MDSLTFIAEMTKALAWPLLIAAVLMIFREQLRALFKRVVSLHWGDWQASFANEEAKVATGLSHANTKALAKGSEENELMLLAERSPRSAVIEAAVRIETELRRIAEPHIPDLNNRPPGQIIRVLQQSGVIDKATATSLQGLFEMRNLAVHSTGEQLTTQRAIEFVTLANAMLFVLGTKSTP
jgi:hypothetical protein